MKAKTTISTVVSALGLLLVLSQVVQAEIRILLPSVAEIMTEIQSEITPVIMTEIQVGDSFGLLRPNRASAALASENKPLAIVRRFRPEVLVRLSGQRSWIEAEMAQQLFDRDTLRTGDEGYAVVQLVDNSIARVRPNSLLIIRGEVNDRDGVNSRILVEMGSMNISVTGRQSEYEILTPTGVAAIKGTQISATVNDDGSSTFTCFSGEVLVSAVNTGQQVTLTRRRRAVVDAGGNTIRVESVSRREVRRMEDEETQLQQAATPKILRFRMMNPAGEMVDVEIPYFERDDSK